MTELLADHTTFRIGGPARRWIEATTEREILDAVAADEWERARDLAYALRDGQEPTAEDLERVAKRTLREPKTLGKKAKGHH